MRYDTCTPKSFLYDIIVQKWRMQFHLHCTRICVIIRLLYIATIKINALLPMWSQPCSPDIHTCSVGKLIGWILYNTKQCGVILHQTFQARNYWRKTRWLGQILGWGEGGENWGISLSKKEGPASMLGLEPATWRGIVENRPFQATTMYGNVILQQVQSVAGMQINEIVGYLWNSDSFKTKSLVNWVWRRHRLVTQSNGAPLVANKRELVMHAFVVGV